jgi:hypothetical protein
VNQAFDVEIGQSEDPDAIMTTRVHAPFGSLGTTCGRAQGPAMTAQFMSQLARRREPEPSFADRRFLPWPTPPERYRVTVMGGGGAEGTTSVTVETPDGRRVSEAVPAGDVFHTAANLMRRMRLDIGDPAWDADAVLRQAMVRALAGRLQSEPKESGSTQRGGGCPEDEVMPLNHDECVALVKGSRCCPGTR